jgi:purine-binding chemotaxis protein CheW
VPELTSPNTEIADIVDAVQRRETQDRVIQIEEHKVQLVLCVLDEKYYAFYGDVIKEIVPVPKLTYVPGMPAFLPGVIHVRGEIESVLDMRKALGLSAGPLTPQSRVALGQVGDMRSGLLVDAVEDVLEVPEDAIHEPASGLDTVKAAFVAGEMLYKEQPLILLDLGKMFDMLFT